MRIKELQNYSIKTVDGAIIKVKDLYFDDELWSVRYLVVNMGERLKTRKVLVSPKAIRSVDEGRLSLLCNLTKKQIDGPAKQTEIINRPGMNFMPYHLLNNIEDNTGNIQSEERWDDHLRSYSEVIGYEVNVYDDQIGNLKGFEIDCRSWVIRKLIIKANAHSNGDEIILEPSKVHSINWSNSEVLIGLWEESMGKYK